MKYNFNKLIDREDTNAIKWQILKDNNCSNDVIPMWIADMDFEVANEIVEAFYKRLQNPIFGYTNIKEQTNEQIVNWFSSRYEYNFTIDDIVITTSVLASLNVAIDLFTNENDKVLIFTPSYHPFVDKTIGKNRKALFSSLKLIDKRYVIDYQNLEEIVDETCKMVILCNPHNPTGVLYTKDELKEFADFCERKELKIFSDEIHADFVFDNKKVYPIMDINDYTKENTVTAVSISKTFNMAGLKVSCAIIKDPTLRDKFIKKAKCLEVSSINIFGFEAIYNSYKYGAEWLDQLLEYLDENRRYCYNFVIEKMPKINIAYPDATYFMWLDFSFTDIKGDLFNILLNEANVFVSNGTSFGCDYAMCARINLAMPKYLIIKALHNIKDVYDKYENEAR